MPEASGAASLPSGTPWDDVVRLAASIAACPVAFVAFDGAPQPILHAHVGLDRTADPAADGLCTQALRTATGDDREAAGVSGEAIWLVLSMPLVDARGRLSGALCVADEQPRRLDDATRGSIAALARIASAMVGAPTLAAPGKPIAAEPLSATPAATVAVAIIEFDGAGLAADAREAMMARIERAVDTAVGAGDVVSRHDARELLLVLADARRAAGTLERVRAAIAAIPGSPRVAIGMATDTKGPVPLEDLFLEAEADLRRVRGRPQPILFVPPGGGVA